MPTGYPTTKVEIAFSDGPYVASPTWTDVSNWVRSVSIQRGRADELQNFDAGTAQVVLDNRDRRFDPTYTSSPYSPNLTPNRQIRISGTVSGTTTVVFRGFVTGWPVTISAAGFDETVTLSCFDALGLLTQENLPVNYADQYIRDLNPNSYYKLDDVIDPTNLAGVTFRDYGSTGADLKFLSPTATVAGSTPPVAPGITGNSLTNSSTADVGGPYPGTSTSSASTFVGWFQVASRGGSTQIANICDIRPGQQSSIQYDYTNSRVTIYTSPNNTGTVTFTNYFATVSLAEGSYHHIGVVFAQSAPYVTAIIVDGISLTVTSSTSTGSTNTDAQFLIKWGARSQLAYWRSALTTTQIQTIYQLASNTYAETTAARANRILTRSSFPAALESITTSPQGTVAEISIDNPPIVAELQRVADSEGGELYVSRTGTLTMNDRFYFTTGRSLTSQATFGTGGMGISTEIQLEISTNGLRNVAQVAYSNNGSTTVEQSSSITSYGRQAEAITTQLSTQSDAQALGNVKSGFGQWPQLTISPIRVNVDADLASWTTVMGLELLDKVTISIPQKVGSAITRTQLIQSIRWDITPSTWSCEIAGSGRLANVFILGTSLLGGTDLLA